MSTELSRAWLVLALAGAMSGCGVVRQSDFVPVCPDYATAVQPVLDLRCGACHGAGGDAGYRLTDYRQSLRPNDDDVRRVDPGDAGSLLLQVARGELQGHVAVSVTDDERTLLTAWVVPCRGGNGVTQFHPAGWADPLNGNDFHGTVVRDGGYTFADCTICHGEDLRGGKSQVDCNSCHAQGPLACNTCHGDELSTAPPRALNDSYSRTTVGVGAHRKHVTDGPLHRAFACESCHPHVANARDEGHYLRQGRFVIDSPTVTLAGVDGGAVAAWDPSAATCTQSACHAPNAADTAATSTMPVWTRTSGQDARCGTCHGLGPTGHLSDRCEGCHGPGYADGGVDLALHVNGVIDFGPGTDCNICHAGPGSTDFYDTHGSRDAGSVSVGAHTAHFATTLRGPVACSECHIVPTRATDPGHIDAPPAKVFPSSWDGGVASADGAMPRYDHPTATCSNVYCHGSGATLLARDATPNLIRNPMWTAGASQDQCGGACHGTPPLDGSLAHTIATSLQTCAMCHGLTVNPDGTIRLIHDPDGGVRSFHIDGVINGNLSGREGAVIIVVGAGIFGVTAALELRARGQAVTLLDRGRIPNPFAESTDLAKAVRLDYGADERSTVWVEQALEQWRSTGLFHETGALTLTRQPMQPAGVEHDSFALLTRRGHHPERLTPGDLRTRFPAWQDGAFADGFFTPHGGWVEAARVVGDLTERARSNGVVVRENTRVEQLLLRGGRVAGVIAGEVLEADAVVLTTGAWGAALAPWLEPVVTPVAQAVFLLRVKDAAQLDAARFPPFAVDSGEAAWFGFPALPGGLVKLASHGRGRPAPPEGPRDVLDTEEQALRAFLTGALPPLAQATVVDRRSCLWGATPDRQFRIARDPQHPELTVATGGSGHAFKFAPLLGTWIADAVMGVASVDLECFRMKPEPGQAAP